MGALWGVWTVLLGIFIFCLVYITRWLSVRLAVAEVELDVNGAPIDSTVTEDADAFISLWLISAIMGVATSSLITEPIIEILRFLIMPCIVSSVGKSKDAVVLAKQKALPTITLATLQEEDGAEDPTEDDDEEVGIIKKSTAVIEARVHQASVIVF